MDTSEPTTPLRKLILAVGSRRTTVLPANGSYSANKTVIHLDIDPAELDKIFIPVSVFPVI